MKAILTSPRFWQLFLAGVAVGIQVYQSTGSLLSAISAAIGSWLGASVIVGTVDRASDKSVQAAKAAGTTTTVTMPESVSGVTATKDN